MSKLSKISDDNDLINAFDELMRLHHRRSLLIADNDNVSYENMNMNEANSAILDIKEENETKLQNDFDLLMKALYRKNLLEKDKKKIVPIQLSHEEAKRDLKSIRPLKKIFIYDFLKKNKTLSYSAAAVILISTSTLFIFNSSNNNQHITKDKIAEVRSKKDTSKTEETIIIAKREENISDDYNKKENITHRNTKNEISRHISYPEYYLKEPEVFGFAPAKKDTVSISPEDIVDYLIQNAQEYNFLTDNMNTLISKKDKYRIVLKFQDSNKVLIHIEYDSDVPLEKRKTIYEEIFSNISNIINKFPQ